ncbi:MAG: internal scaffolding protein [Microviridae sp.]|nr:MAG: internal scaffolding protein [Microviridae sp.]
MPFLRTAFNYDMDQASYESGLFCNDVSMAQQQFVEESDINTIVDRYGLNGSLPDVVRAPQYGDFTSIYDFHTAMNAVNEAKASFMSLPAKTRARFENDPQQFLEFVSNDANYQEARDLGLLEVLTDAPVKVPGLPTNRDAPVEASKAP